MAQTWDFEGYWNVVLGANRSAADVVVPTHVDERAPGAWGEGRLPESEEERFCEMAATMKDVSPT